MREIEKEARDCVEACSSMRAVDGEVGLNRVSIIWRWAQHICRWLVTFRGFVDMQLCVCVSVVSTDALTGRNSRAVTAHASLRSRIVTPGPAAVARFQRRSYMHEIQRTGVANL